MKNTMKKMLGVIVVLSFICSIGITVSASVDKSDRTSTPASAAQQERYSQYEKILSEISKKYGIEASLEPIEWFVENEFPSEEEFTEQVETNCRTLAHSHSTDAPVTEPDSAENGINTNGVQTYTWKDTQYKSSYGITVTFSFAVTVAQNPDTEKYFISQFSAFKPTLSGTGQGVVTSYSTTVVDGGRTRVTTAQMTLTKDGVNYSKTSSAYVYCNANNGNISIQGS